MNSISRKIVVETLGSIAVFDLERNPDEFRRVSREQCRLMSTGNTDDDRNHHGSEQQNGGDSSGSWKEPLTGTREILITAPP